MRHINKPCLSIGIVFSLSFEKFLLPKRLVCSLKAFKMAPSNPQTLGISNTCEVLH